MTVELRNRHKTDEGNKNSNLGVYLGEHRRTQDILNNSFAFRMVQCSGKPERKDTFRILHPAPFFLDMVLQVRLTFAIQWFSPKSMKLHQLETRPCFMPQAGGAKLVDLLQISRQAMEEGDKLLWW